MKTRLSLRARLTAIILAPLVLIALAIAAWSVRDARIRADDDDPISRGHICRV